MSWQDSGLAESFSQFFVDLCNPLVLSRDSVLAVCRCITLLCSRSADAKKFFQESPVFESCLDLMSSPILGPVSVVYVVNEFLRSVYNVPLDDFHDVLGALNEARTLSADHAEAVAATLVTILERPDSRDFIDPLMELVSGLVSQDGSDDLVETLLILARQIILLDAAYYEVLVSRGILGFLWDIRAVEPRDRLSPLSPHMLDLLRCVITSVPLARGPFTLEASLVVLPRSYVTSILACGAGIVEQWFDIIANFPVGPEGIQSLIEAVSQAVLPDASFEIKTAWLTAWYTSAFLDNPVFLHSFLSSGLIGVLSGLIDSRDPALECYFGLILRLVDSCTDRHSLIGAFFDDGSIVGTRSVFDMIVEFVDDAPSAEGELAFTSKITGEWVDLYQQASEICKILTEWKQS
jgi:hypothetical protein